MTEPDRVSALIAQVEVASGTTWNGLGTNVAIINNRAYPVKVDIHEMKPPPPPPACPEWLDIGADDCCTISCENRIGYHEYHWAVVNGNLVKWEPKLD